MKNGLNPKNIGCKLWWANKAWNGKKCEADTSRFSAPFFTSDVDLLLLTFGWPSLKNLHYSSKNSFIHISKQKSLFLSLSHIHTHILTNIHTYTHINANNNSRNFTEENKLLTSKLSANIHFAIIFRTVDIITSRRIF